MSQRIVSLIASSTEIVCALGFEDWLVGRSHECDFPATVSRLPVLTSPKLPADGTSYEIDQKLKAILQEGLSVYRVDAERLKSLKPDILLTQTQCEVCAVSLKDVEQALCGWVDSRPRIVSLEPNRLSDVWDDIGRVAGALGAQDRGVELVARLQERVKSIQGRSGAAARRPTAACIEWIEPLMAAGNWMPELIDLAGGTNLFGEAGKHSPWMRFEELCAKNPDFILVLPCGWGMDRARREMPALTRRPQWRNLRAVKEGRVCLLDGHQYFNRPGPRLAESLEILAEILHPEIFSFGHKGFGWEPL